MSKNDIALFVDGVTKIYKLYDHISDRMKEALSPLRKRYSKDHYALNNINLKFNKGESVGIIGENGSGKSTLLKVITGVVHPSQGKIYVNGKISAILELGSGFNQDLNGVDNILLNASLNGLSREEARGKLAQIIDFAELGGFINQPLKTYSSGMKARLAFAVAVCIDPDIFIVDEALSVGDAAFSRKCMARMEEIKKSNATILFVSHGLGSVVNLCDRVLWIDKGRVVVDGDPKLVTGLYMKNSGKKNIDIVKIAQVYEEMLLSEGEAQIVIKKDKSLKPVPVSESYNVNIKSKSSISYDPKGARILNFGIKDEKGAAVNILKSGKVYKFHYNVKFLRKLNNVQYSFLIKNKEGVAIAGGVFPGKNEQLAFQEGEKCIEVSFKCALNLGDYFFNAGVMALVDSRIDYAHRVLDAIMFKVEGPDQRATGLVDLVVGYELRSQGGNVSPEL